MYKKLNITELHLGAISLFTDYGREFHIREIARLLHISPRAAQLALESLEEKAVIGSNTRGRNKVYSLKQTESAKDYLLIAEQYKLIAFSESHPLILEIIAKIKPHISGIGAIFGSYTKGIEKKGSDLDIFVAGECSISTIRKIGKAYGIDINVKRYPMAVFENSIKSDILVKEVVKNHVIFLNAGQFIDMVFKNG